MPDVQPQKCQSRLRRKPYQPRQRARYHHHVRRAKQARRRWQRLASQLQEELHDYAASGPVCRAWW